MPILDDLYYSEYRDSSAPTTPILLIHGAGGNHLSWPPQHRRLPNAHVYALDLPGHGKSKRPGEQTIDGYVNAVTEWMNRANLPRAIVVGHSMGGAVALRLALSHPTKVVALGLFGTGARLVVHPDLLDGTSHTSSAATAIDQIIDWSFGPESDPKMVALVRQRFHEMRTSVLHGDLRACDAFNFLDKLERIPHPTLVACGTADKMTPLRYSQYLANKIPRGQLVIVQNAGHMLMLEKPRETADILQDFIAQIQFNGP